MKTLGIVGGIAPESTIEYYRQIVALCRKRKPDGHYPRIIINSIDMKQMLDMIGADDLSGVTGFLLGEVNKLAEAGADIGLLASNTPHIVFDEIARQTTLPLVSIVESACAAARELGLKNVGLFGTRFTMQGEFYPRVFSREAISLVVPDADDQAYIHDRYMSELVNGIFRDETRDHLYGIADRLRQQAGIQGVILGGTELPLIFRGGKDRGIPFLDTTRAHVECAVDLMLTEEAI